MALVAELPPRHDFGLGIVQKQELRGGIRALDGGQVFSQSGSVSLSQIGWMGLSVFAVGSGWAKMVVQA